jgi:hypothetical protein
MSCAEQSLASAPSVQRLGRRWPAPLVGLLVAVGVSAATVLALAQGVNDVYTGGDADQLSWRDYFANYPSCRFFVRQQWKTEANLFQANLSFINARTDAEKRPSRQRVRELTTQRSALERFIV